MNDLILSVKNINKWYGGVHALDEVSMDISKGEIHCLVGENGSGKSTLVKIIGGVEKPNAGEIFINSKKFRNLKAIDSIHQGIQIIYQDLALFPNLSVVENIGLSQLIEKRKNFINWKKAKDNAKKELENLGVTIDLNEIIENLNMSNKQVVAIARALTQRAKLIIMDEPTTAITKSEVEKLFSIILDLQKAGISFLFVTHKLSEVFQISENVTVLRDGRKVIDVKTTEIDNDKLVYYMTGKKIEYTKYTFEKKPDVRPILEVKDLSKKDHYRNINFKVFPGEILGITGLLGSGKTEIALSIFGLNKADLGNILIEGKQIKINSAIDAINIGISYLPEDKNSLSLFMKQSVTNNIVVTIYDKIVNKFKMVLNKKKDKIVNDLIKSLDIKTPSPENVMSSLSGGNQQRVVLAKWLATNPKIFILDNPTIGIDIASKKSIHEMIKELARKGIGIILISNEITEVYNNCNRILVMKNGVIAREFNPQKTTEDEIFKTVIEDELQSEVS